ncbi:hypothetical protein ACFL15_02330 [Patescibacteria group bacterium]
MYTLKEYIALTEKYGSSASWAIWDYKNEKDTSIIGQNRDQLHSRYILLGLNFSKETVTNKPWKNFHGGSIHDRKLKYACNDTELRGSFMTDIFRGIVETDSSKMKDIITDKIISKNVSFFNQEMMDIKINKESKFIVFGTPTSYLAKCFNEYFKQGYTNNVIYHYHYSYYGITDEEWVKSLWEKLYISQDFEATLKKYGSS